MDSPAGEKGKKRQKGGGGNREEEIKDSHSTP